jgi:hypothetical protein
MQYFSSVVGFIMQYIMPAQWMFDQFQMVMDVFNNWKLIFKI